MLPVVSHEAKTERWPYVTICLIGLNLIVFAFEATIGVRFIPFLQEWGLVPARVNAEITVHNMATLGSSMFLHVSVIHVLSNMWFLYVFGDSVEDALGPRWYLFLYLTAGFFGSIAYIAASSGSPTPVVGASGAIAGVMAASLVMWPTARLKAPGVFLLIYTLSLLYTLLNLVGLPAIVLGGPVVFVLGALLTLLMSRGGGGLLAAMLRGVEVPAYIVLGLFLGMQLYSGALALVNPAYGGSVGWWAHIGGFASGALFTWLFPKHPVLLRKRAVLE
jgi:membrane associated rhomboid family serine protease